MSLAAHLPHGGVAAVKRLAGGRNQCGGSSCQHLGAAAKQRIQRRKRLLLHFQVDIHGSLRQLAGSPQLRLCGRPRRLHTRQCLLQRFQPAQPVFPLSAGQLGGSCFQGLLQLWIQALQGTGRAACAAAATVRCL